MANALPNAIEGDILTAPLDTDVLATDEAGAWCEPTREFFVATP